MAIPLPKLDDRRFADLVQELRTLIPRYAPQWTDHNASDPGITLIELFAWLSESLMYRIDQVGEASEARFLELLGASFAPASPAVVTLRVVARTPPTQAYFAGERLIATPADGGEPLGFVTVHDLVLREEVAQGETVYAGSVTALQMERVSGEPLGVSNGERFQAFRLGRPHVVTQAPDGVEAVFSLAPEVRVDGESWRHRRDLLASAAADHHFTVEPRINAVRFGDGGRDAGSPARGAGLIPPRGAAIDADYYFTLGARGGVDASARFAFARDAGGELEVSVSGTPLAGRDPVDLRQAREQAHALLRTRVRAITAEDFEQIVLAEPAFSLARVECVPGVDLAETDSEAARQDDFVSLVIVPRGTSSRPTPSDELIGAVAAFIDRRRLLTTRHRVLAPHYTEVTLSAEVVAEAQLPDERVREAIIADLKAFFDPFTGAGGGGWPFGRDVHRSEVFQVLEDSEGVDHVERLSLKTRDDASSPWREPAGGERIVIPARNLVDFAAGAVSIRVRGER